MNRLGTSPDNALTEVTELLRISFCESDVDEMACWRRRLFSFGVAMTTTSSMSITLVVSLTNALSVSVGAAKTVVVTAAASEARIVRFISV